MIVFIKTPSLQANSAIRPCCVALPASIPYAYLFSNRRTTRMKVLVHGGFGIWLAARRLNQGRFHWLGIRHGSEMSELPTQRASEIEPLLPHHNAPNLSKSKSGGDQHPFAHK
ncbi:MULTISPECIES: IS66 family insertion sequence element accessory protein TnpB [Pseudomonas syringae group]|uniref:IS66 Orf2 like protein n=2 Tax=Pseudomonas syringae TaxID=317 RepID=F3G857_PSESJ|nr:IS66 Orf2 like protein [Pseudomonas syringae pv. pisi str. 1704B]